MEQTYFRRGDLGVQCAEDFLFLQLLCKKVDFPLSRQKSAEMQRIAIAFLAQKVYGIEEREEAVEKAAEEANVEHKLKFQPFDSGEYFTPLKNKFQRLQVVLKNQQHQELKDSAILVDIEGAEVVQRFQLRSRYTLSPHQEVALQPFVILTQ